MQLFYDGYPLLLAHSWLYTNETISHAQSKEAYFGLYKAYRSIVEQAVQHRRLNPVHMLDFG